MSASTITPTLPGRAADTTTADAEFSLLLTVCSHRQHGEKLGLIRSLGDGLEWKRVWDLADRHRVLPLLLQALACCEDLVPAAEMRVLEKLNQTNIHKTLLLARELIRVTDDLSEAGIEVIPYKGVALAEFVYGDIAMRQAGDIDLLIRAEDFHRVRKSLRALGYAPHVSFSPAQERAYLKTGYEYAFDGAAGPNLLEVQWAVQPRFYAVDLKQDGLFHRASGMTIAGHRMKALSPEDLFIVVSLHAAKHLWARLIWLCDIARITRLPSLNWDWIAAQGKQLGVARILRVGLLIANRLLNAEIPNRADEVLDQDPDASRLASEIETGIRISNSCDPESLAYFTLMLRLRERVTDRLRFIVRLAFTPGPGEWAAVRLPQSLLPLYQFVRFYRLGRKLVTS